MDKILGTTAGLGIGGVIGAFVGAMIGVDGEAFDGIVTQLLNHVDESGVNRSDMGEVLEIIREIDPALGFRPEDNVALGELTNEMKSVLTPIQEDAYNALLEKVDHEAIIDKATHTAETLLKGGAVGTVVGAGTGVVVGYNMSDSKMR